MSEFDRLGKREHEVRETGRLIYGFAHPLRLQILICLASAKKTAGMLALKTGHPPAQIIEQLDYLLGLGLVARELQGDLMWYTLAGPQVETVLQALENVLRDRLLQNSLAEGCQPADSSSLVSPQG